MTLILLPLIILPLLQLPHPTTSGSVGGCTIFPSDNVFNTPIDGLPVHSRSSEWMALFGTTRKLHPDFGTQYEDPPGTWNQIGIPYNIVPSTQPLVGVEYKSLGGWPDESDAGPMPIPHGAAKELPDEPDGDSHVLVIRQGECKLYELYYSKENADHTWSALSGAIFDLSSNKMRGKLGDTSADAAGFPIMPLLVRREDLTGSGEVDHAFRMTITSSYIKSYVWPASHETSSSKDGPPYGTRFRLKSTYTAPANFPASIQKFVRALKKYGLILADGGSDFYVSGTHDPLWNDNDLNYIKQIPVNQFEIVDASKLKISSTSYAVSLSNVNSSNPNSNNPLTGLTSSGNSLQYYNGFNFMIMIWMVMMINLNIF
jgi:hypothetical protein